MRRSVRLVFLAATLVLTALVLRARRRTEDPLPTVPDGPTGDPWPPLAGVAGPAVDVGAPAVDDRTWVEADRSGTCPASHPLKAKAASGIVHSPGQAHYDRTSADRCYADLPTAEADGYRPAKR